MKRRRYYFAGILLVAFAIVLAACLLTSRVPFEFIPDNAKIIRPPSRALRVYVFPADFNSIMPEVELELESLDFIYVRRAGRDDPNETI